jgi:hypothetical protein
MPKGGAVLTVGPTSKTTKRSRSKEQTVSVLDIVAVVVIVGYVIGKQLLGEHLRSKRLILLPVVLVALGLSQLLGHGNHPRAADIALIAVSAVVASAIGVTQGTLMRLEARDGTLWGQMPLRSLWLWTALVGSRIVVDVIAHGTGAHLAASTAPIILTLGINRLAQAAVVAPRALAAGIPFTPEKNGSTFLGDVFAAPSGPAKRPSTASPPRSAASASGNGWQSGLRLLAEHISTHAERR